MTIDSSFILLFGIILICSLYRRRSERHIVLPADKFWSVVHSQEHPVVFLGTRGLVIKRPCYIFPYQGIILATRASETMAPEGIKLIGAGDAFSIM